RAKLDCVLIHTCIPARFPSAGVMPILASRSRSMSRNRVCFAIVCLSLLMTWVSPVLGQARSPEKLWDDFNHYVLIARPELAHAAGQALLNQVNDDQLLDIVEASDFADWLDRVKVRAD